MSGLPWRVRIANWRGHNVWNEQITLPLGKSLRTNPFPFSKKRGTFCSACPWLLRIDLPSRTAEQQPARVALTDCGGLCAATGRT